MQDSTKAIFILLSCFAIISCESNLIFLETELKDTVNVFNFFENQEVSWAISDQLKYARITVLPGYVSAVSYDNVDQFTFDLNLTDKDTPYDEAYFTDKPSADVIRTPGRIQVFNSSDTTKYLLFKPNIKTAGQQITIKIYNVSNILLIEKALDKFTDLKQKTQTFKLNCY